MTDEVYKAVADKTRRQILDLLRTGGAQRAGDIATHFPEISRPAVSKHLRVLREVNLVLEQEKGRELWYRLNPTPLQEVNDWLSSYQTLWNDRLQDLKQIIESQKDKENE
jgi:DNA-binding transcriptional ArsR family regulator